MMFSLQVRLGLVPIVALLLALLPPQTGDAQFASGGTDEDAVRGVIYQYRMGFEALDAEAVRAIWPDVDTRALTRAFAQLESQQINFAQCWVSVSAERATAGCTGNAEFVPKVGSGNVRSESREWEFALRKNAEVWQIERVDSH